MSDEHNVALAMLELSTNRNDTDTDDDEASPKLDVGVDIEIPIVGGGRDLDEIKDGGKEPEDPRMREVTRMNIPDHARIALRKIIQEDQSNSLVYVDTVGGSLLLRILVAVRMSLEPTATIALVLSDRWELNEAWRILKSWFNLGASWVHAHDGDKRAKELYEMMHEEPIAPRIVLVTMATLINDYKRAEIRYDKELGAYKVLGQPRKDKEMLMYDFNHTDVDNPVNFGAFTAVVAEIKHKYFAYSKLYELPDVSLLQNKPSWAYLALHALVGGNFCGEVWSEDGSVPLSTYRADAVLITSDRGFLDNQFSMLWAMSLFSDSTRILLEAGTNHPYMKEVTFEQAVLMCSLDKGHAVKGPYTSVLHAAKILLPLRASVCLLGPLPPTKICLDEGPVAVYAVPVTSTHGHGITGPKTACKASAKKRSKKRQVVATPSTPPMLPSTTPSTPPMLPSTTPSTPPMLPSTTPSTVPSSPSSPKKTTLRERIKQRLLQQNRCAVPQEILGMNPSSSFYKA